jgi:excisionase family DNA binding protein
MPASRVTNRFEDRDFRLAFGVRETAEILGVSEKTIRRLIQRKLLRSSVALRHKLIPKKEIERFLDETTR